MEGDPPRLSGEVIVLEAGRGQKTWRAGRGREAKTFPWYRLVLRDVTALLGSPLPRAPLSNLIPGAQKGVLGFSGLKMLGASVRDPS